MRAHSVTFSNACLPRQGMVNLYKRNVLKFIITETQCAIQTQVTQQPNYTKRRHVDVTTNGHSARVVFTFPSVDVCRTGRPGQRSGLGVACVMKVCSWTRRLREIRAVGGPEVGGKRVGLEGRWRGGRLGWGKDAWGGEVVFIYKFVVV